MTFNWNIPVFLFIILLFKEKEDCLEIPGCLASQDDAPSTLTYHSILRVCLLVVHLPDLLVCGCVDLTQHAEPLAVGRREQLSTNDQPLDVQNSGSLLHTENDTSSEQLGFLTCLPLRVKGGFPSTGEPSYNKQPKYLHLPSVAIWGHWEDLDLRVPLQTSTDI